MPPINISDLLALLGAFSAGGAFLFGFLKAFAAWEKKQGRAPEPKYKADFMETLGGALTELTSNLREIRTDVKEMKPIIVAVDQDTNYPRPWSDNKQAKRTHDAVGILGEAVGELTVIATESNKKVNDLATQILEIHRKVGAP